MKKLLCKISFIVLIISILANVYFWQSEKRSEAKMEKKEVVLQNIFARKSVRDFLPNKIIEKKDLELLIKSGMAAPSGKNLQPWRFIIIDDREILNKLVELDGKFHVLKNASAAIFVGADAKDTPAPLYWLQDCSAATENILLAIEAMGLGGVWLGLYPQREFDSGFRKLLNLPEDILSLCLISVGHPNTEEKAKNKWKPEKLRWQKW